MIDKISIPWSLLRLEYGREIPLSTGDIVIVNHALKTRRIIKGSYVSPGDELFYTPLKPGDHYITEVSNMTIRYDFTEEQLADPRGSTYFYYKHLEKIGLVTIRPAIKLESK